MKKRILAIGLLLLTLWVSGCSAGTTGEKRYEKLLGYFESQGWQCRVEPLMEGTPVPIYKASVWQALWLGEEQVLLYFDDSNRADFHVANLKKKGYTCVTRFGLRFVLLYEGQNADVMEALETIPVE